MTTSEPNPYQSPLDATQQVTRDLTGGEMILASVLALLSTVPFACAIAFTHRFLVADGVNWASRWNGVFALALAYCSFWATGIGLLLLSCAVARQRPRHGKVGFSLLLGTVSCLVLSMWIAKL